MATLGIGVMSAEAEVSDRIEMLPGLPGLVRMRRGLLTARRAT